MKKLFLAAIMACGFSMTAMAQTQVKFEHSQARIQEAASAFFVRPMVAELQMLAEKCQEYGPFNIYPGVPIDAISMEHVDNAKANAAYKAASLAGADIILGATFNVVNGDNKTKGLNVIVRGYPAKYVNFHSLGEGDSKWVQELFEYERIKILGTGTGGQDVTRAVNSTNQK